MPLIVEIIVIIVTMMGAFFLVFMLMFLLAMFLAPIELSLSKLVWGKPKPQAKVQTPKSSFKDFSQNKR